MLRGVRLGMGVNERVVDEVVRRLWDDRRWTYIDRAVGLDLKVLHDVGSGLASSLIFKIEFH